MTFRVIEERGALCFFFLVFDSNKRQVFGLLFTTISVLLLLQRQGQHPHPRPLGGRACPSWLPTAPTTPFLLLLLVYEH